MRGYQSADRRQRRSVRTRRQRAAAAADQLARESMVQPDARTVFAILTEKRLEAIANGGKFHNTINSDGELV